MQVLHVAFWQSVEPGLLQKGSGFFEAETQLACVQLHRLAIGPQAMDIEHGQFARANHQTLLRSENGKQARKQSEDIRVVDFVQVVEKQGERFVASSNLLGQLHRVGERTVRYL
ncbi:hypothetical protein D9M71_708170 [compost metagenome]